jgi:preprotein translocase subunit SecE
VTETRGGAATAERPAPRPSSAAGGRGRRGNPFARLSLFYRQVVAELRKVIWPTRKELVTYTSVVLVFVTVMTAIVAVFDIVFGKGVLWVFG